MKRRLLLLLISAAPVTACAEPESSAIVITNATVIDAVNGVRENQIVVFDGDEITNVGPTGTEPPVAETIDGTGKFLIPGLSLLEANRCATVRLAEFFSLADEMGTVDVGKRADLVLLDANPLEDIANTRQIAAVVSRCKLLTQTDLSVRVSAAHSRHS